MGKRLCSERFKWWQEIEKTHTHLQTRLHLTPQILLKTSVVRGVYFDPTLLSLVRTI